MAKAVLPFYFQAMKNFSFLICLLFVALNSSPAIAQQTAPVLGLHGYSPGVYAFTHCNLVPEPGTLIKDATLLIREGRVVAAGSSVSIPRDAEVRDLKGRWVFPGLIEAWSHFGLNNPKPDRKVPNPQYNSKKEGPYAWNQAVKPEYQVAATLRHKAKEAASLRQSGFTLLHVAPNDGIFRGTSALYLLNDEKAQNAIVLDGLKACMSFSKGSSTQDYPSSLMGAIALIRQTLIDAAWYEEAWKNYKRRPGGERPETNLSLQAIVDQLDKKESLIFDVSRDYQYALRAAAIAKEFDLELIYKMDGDAYKRIEAIRNLAAPLIVPLNFPKAFQVNDPADAREINLSQLKHWELAPTNPGVLEQNKVPFALTSTGLKDVKRQFWGQLHKAIRYGLSAKEALASLTTTPAAILGLEKDFGTLRAGKVANFLIASEDLFQIKNASILETWVAGKRFVHQEEPDWEPRGTWQVQAGSLNPELDISGAPGKYQGSLSGSQSSDKVTISVSGREMALSFSLNDRPYRSKGVYNASKKEIRGQLVDPDGQRIKWTAKRKSDYSGEQKALSLEAVDRKSLGAVPFPFGPFGHEKLPQEKDYFIKGATVWTNTDQGIIEGCDVLISKGKIAAVGKSLKAPSGAVMVKGQDLHLTAGIIDEHSHIAISQGVNEGTHGISSEVRIGDVVNATDINIYRQLSGGVTTSHLLHGSANPIGGQTALIKLRWGMLPEEMKFEGADGFIKFALGENVKQANWGDDFKSRYPQTRLGVEQLMEDAFQAARDYKKAEKAAGGKGTLPHRKNLQSEALWEILQSQRFITCHSYVQSELNMLMKLAERNGFIVNTFTHVLEGFKVADKIAKHGAYASTFSDWWAYKYEVIDAIPYNSALMAENGVTVCVNSDDAEMGRRLNQEAAKAVKYGGMSEEEALKLVTLNPAKALHVDDRVGSIEKGKDADLVLWTEHPLSIYASSQKTWVDGRLYFDREKDQAMHGSVLRERSRLISKLLEDKSPDKQAIPKGDSEKLYHCDDLESSYTHE